MRRKLSVDSRTQRHICYAYERKIVIGKSSGAVFQVTPQKEDWGVGDYFRCIRLAIEMLLEQKGDHSQIKDT